MSIIIMKLVWDDDSGRLTPTEKLLLTKLADYGSEDGLNIYPSYKTISRKTNLSRATVVRVIQSLKAKGFISLLSPGISRFKTARYRINLGIFSKVEENGALDCAHPEISQNEHSDIILSQNEDFSQFDCAHGEHQLVSYIDIIINTNSKQEREECDIISKESKKLEKINEESLVKVNDNSKELLRGAEDPLNKISYLTSIEPSKTPTEAPMEILEQESNDIFTMIGIWKEIISKSETILPSTKIKDALQVALSKRFGNSIDKWRTYCEQIASIEFLRGKNQTGWKAQLFWAIKLENIDKILSGVIYGKKKPFKAKTDQVPIELTKNELIEEVFASNDDETIKRAKIALLDYMYAHCKASGLISYHTYLRHAEFITSEQTGKKILSIHSSYNAFNGLMPYHDLLTKAYQTFDEVVIFGGSNDHRGNKLYMDRKSTVVAEPCYIWEQLCIEKGIESIMLVSQAMIVNSYSHHA